MLYSIDVFLRTVIDASCSRFVDVNQSFCCWVTSNIGCAVMFEDLTNFHVFDKNPSMYLINQNPTFSSTTLHFRWNSFFVADFFCCRACSMIMNLHLVVTLQCVVCEYWELAFVICLHCGVCLNNHRSAEMANIAQVCKFLIDVWHHRSLQILTLTRP